MIHYISGKLASLAENYAVLDCGGIGFRIGISCSAGSKLSGLAGRNVLLYTYMAVSEDNMSLYGFFEEDELELFKKLISVSGVGPKGAMSILGALSPDELRSAVANGDAKTISSAQGIGLKTAQKLIIELKDKIGAGDVFMSAAASADSEKTLQVIDALALYGFPRAHVAEALKKLDASLPLEELLSQTLRILGKESGR